MTIKLSSKSQIVIPAEARRQLGLRPGDRLSIEVERDAIVLRKAPESALDGLEEFIGDAVWSGYAEELLRERTEGDQRASTS